MHPALEFLSSVWHSLLAMLSSLFGQQNQPEPQCKNDHDHIASSKNQITTPEPSECFFRSIPTKENILEFPKINIDPFPWKTTNSHKKPKFFFYENKVLIVNLYIFDSNFFCRNQEGETKEWHGEANWSYKQTAGSLRWSKWRFAIWFTTNRCRWLSKRWQKFGFGKHCWKVSTTQWLLLTTIPH